MARLKIALATTLAVLGLLVVPALAFGPMMKGSHQHGDDTGHKDPTAGHADSPQAPVASKHAEPVDKGRSPINPPAVPQHADSRGVHRSDAESGR